MMIKYDTQKRWYNIYILCAILLVLSFVVRHPNYENKTYRNEDAVYHVLLTMIAYDETPVSEHHFVPIVSLGGEDNKCIRWGATVADENGNYYYTSFSPAGFVAPYLFIKMLHLPICESSLYLFNSILFTASLIVLVGLMTRLFKGIIPIPYICLFTAVLYLFSPEIMHSQGVTYWHQSLFQLTFLIQLYLCQYFRENNSKKAFVLFVFLSILNPYIEWSEFAEDILTEFSRSDTIFIQENCSTRGYTNLLWNGGVYEWTSIEDAKLIAKEKNKRYIACLKSINHWWNMYEYTECEIFDLLTGESTVIQN